MSINPDNYDDEFDEGQPQFEQQATPAKFRKRLAEVERERDEALARAQRSDQLERENSLYKANLGNLNEDQQAALLATAKEMTPDALRSQAERLGFVAPPEPTVSVADLEAHDRIGAAVAGGQTPSARDWDTDIANATSMEELEALTRERGTHVDVARQG